MKLKHLKTINELYSDTYRSAAEKWEKEMYRDDTYKSFIDMADKAKARENNETIFNIRLFSQKFLQYCNRDKTLKQKYIDQNINWRKMSAYVADIETSIVFRSNLFQKTEIPFLSDLFIDLLRFDNSTKGIYNYSKYIVGKTEDIRHKDIFIFYLEKSNNIDKIGTIDTLIKAGFSIFLMSGILKYDLNFLLYCISNEYDDITNYLLDNSDKNTLIESLNNDKYFDYGAIHLAISNNNIKLCQKLIDLGIDPLVKDENKGRTIFDYIDTKDLDLTKKTIEYLISLKKKLNIE